MDTPEESGEPVNTEPTTPPLRTPITLVPPPLSQAQVEKIVKAAETVGEAAEAVGEAIGALGSLYGDYCKWVFSRIKPMLIPPLWLRGEIQESPTTPPSTTP